MTSGTFAMIGNQTAPYIVGSLLEALEYWQKMRRMLIQ